MGIIEERKTHVDKKPSGFSRHSFFAYPSPPKPRPPSVAYVLEGEFRRAMLNFKTMLKYKASAQQHGIFVEVPENFSTQICSSCEEIPDSAPKGVKDLGVRGWVCSSCGAVHDRDVNAAMNILRFGRESLVPKVAQESPTIAASAV